VLPAKQQAIMNSVSDAWIRQGTLKTGDGTRMSISILDELFVFFLFIYLTLMESAKTVQ